MVAMPSVSTLTRRSLHSELVEALQDLIVNGELSPGSKVPERDLCEQFGVSRTPMREALKVLAADGLIDLTPGRGAWVKQMTRAEHDEAFPVMAALEALAGELACQHISDEEIAAIEELHNQMRAQFDAGDQAAYFRSNQMIHQAIVAATRNATLQDYYRSLSARLRRGRYLAAMDPETWASSMAEHEEILQTLLARDGARLSTVLRAHLNSKSGVIEEWLSDE